MSIFDPPQPLSDRLTMRSGKTCLSDGCVPGRAGSRSSSRGDSGEEVSILLMGL